MIDALKGKWRKCMKSFETKGVWWLPGREEHRITGILKFNPEDGV